MPGSADDNLWIVIAVSDGLRDTDSWLVNKGCLLLWIFGAFLVPVLALLLYVLSILLA